MEVVVVSDATTDAADVIYSLQLQCTQLGGGGGGGNQQSYIRGGSTLTSQPLPYYKTIFEEKATLSHTLYLPPFTYLK